MESNAVLLDSDDAWGKNPFAIVVNDSFADPLSALMHQVEYDIADVQSGKDRSEQGNAILRIVDANADLTVQSRFGNRILGGVSPFTKKLAEVLNQHIPKAKGLYDTTVGGNLTFNPLWQFSVDDDIVHPMDCTSEADPLQGLGRVYAETYQNQQRILWLRFGVPKFKNLKDFYTESGGTLMSTYVNTGNWSGAAHMAKFLTDGLVLAVELPFLPMIWIKDIADAFSEDSEISKYYDVRPTMCMYFQLVNVMLSQLAVNFGLFRMFSDSNPTSGGLAKDGYKSQVKDAGIPSLLRDHGPDIWAIMEKRVSRMEGRKARTIQQLQDSLKIGDKDKKYPEVKDPKTGKIITPAKKESFFSTAIDSIIAGTGAIKHTAKGGFDWVGFRIEKGTDSSESISNQTGASEVAGMLNSAAEKGRNRTFISAAGNIGVPVIDGLISGIKQVAEGVSAGLGLGSPVDLVTGNGVFDIPDVWKGSSFSKSYSFDIQLRSKYADPVSIYQSMYIPLCMILAAALPRGTGPNMYTSPFILEAYADGMFAVPVGIIESVSIKRGLAEHGWSIQGLPTAIDVSVTIKDLSPAFFLSMGDDQGDFRKTLGKNSSLQNYMATLSGFGIADRTFKKRNILNKIDAAVLINRNTTLNPLFWGNKVGEFNIIRAIANTSSNWYTPN